MLDVLIVVLQLVNLAVLRHVIVHVLPSVLEELVQDHVAVGQIVMLHVWLDVREHVLMEVVRRRVLQIALAQLHVETLVPAPARPHVQGLVTIYVDLDVILAVLETVEL